MAKNKVDKLYTMQLTKEEALKRAEYFKAHGKKVKVISNKELFD